VIAHLIYNKYSLLACSLTCYSWYIAVAAHLHHTLIATTCSWSPYQKLRWPKPLWNTHKLGLLPLVRKFQIHDEPTNDPGGISTKQFNRRILRHPPGLTNVQELGIDHLEIPTFIPRIQRYFGHFSLTVKSLALRDPRGSRRQVLYFIGLFQHLDDLKLIYDEAKPQNEPENDLTLVPPFTPPLRGRLTATCFTRVDLLKDMIYLFGGTRFRHMDLYCVQGMRLLLDTCAETLETLQLYPCDPHCERLFLQSVQSLINNSTVWSFPGDFDLSQNKSLRTLETTVPSIDAMLVETSPDNPASPLTHMLSTITSPVFSEVVAFYRDYNFPGARFCAQTPSLKPRVYPPKRKMTRVKEENEASWHRGRFEVYRELHKVRNFQLVLCVDVWDCDGEYSLQRLKRYVANEKARGGFSRSSEPLVDYRPRGSRPHLSELQFGAGIFRSSIAWTPL